MCLLLCLQLRIVCRSLTPSVLTFRQFDKWVGFHDDAQNSTGIGAHKKTTSEMQSSWPADVEQAIKDNTYVNLPFALKGCLLILSPFLLKTGPTMNGCEKEDWFCERKVTLIRNQFWESRGLEFDRKNIKRVRTC